MTNPGDPRRLSWPRTAGVAVVVVVVGYLGSTLFPGNDEPAQVPAGESVVDQPLDAAGNPAGGRVGADTADASPESPTGSTSPAAGTDPARTTSLRSAPTTWQQEIAAAAPGDPIRLTPKASDWTAENIVIGKDLSGKFLGRVTLRYAGPGFARGTFAVALISDGRVVTTLTGELADVRSGTYQLMLESTADWVEGPWTTQFRVVSTT